MFGSAGRASPFLRVYHGVNPNYCDLVGWPYYTPPAQNGAMTTTICRIVDILDGTSTTFNSRNAPRVDGNFTGTTDEIIQWAACRWGFDEDTVRAQAVQESFWRQDAVGDFANGIYQSHGLLQVKTTLHHGTDPLATVSTAFNVDYTLAWRRASLSSATSLERRRHRSNGSLWGP